jgi:hypothetical protein
MYPLYNNCDNTPICRSCCSSRSGDCDKCGDERVKLYKKWKISDSSDKKDNTDIVKKPRIKTLLQQLKGNQNDNSRII